jgi:hypothetical protein
VKVPTLRLNLKRPQEAGTVDRLRRALAEHYGLLFRDADITPGQQIALSRPFSRLEAHLLAEFSLPRHPEVFVVSNVKEGGRRANCVVDVADVVRQRICCHSVYSLGCQDPGSPTVAQHLTEAQIVATRRGEPAASREARRGLCDMPNRWPPTRRWINQSRQLGLRYAKADVDHAERLEQSHLKSKASSEATSITRASTSTA